MKTIIAGGRDHQFRESDVSYLDQEKATITEVVCGCAAGADECGRRWAVANNIPVKKFPADWDAYGNGAGPIRNREMAKYAERLRKLYEWRQNE